MRSEVVAALLIIHLFAGATKSTKYEINMTRLFGSSRGDRYSLSPAGCAKYKCSDFGGLPVGGNGCDCQCSKSNATLSKNAGYWSCSKHVQDTKGIYKFIICFLHDVVNGYNLTLDSCPLIIYKIKSETGRYRDRESRYARNVLSSNCI